MHVCDVNEAELNQRLQTWQELHLPITGSICDVSSHAQRKNLMERISNIFDGKLNILVRHVTLMNFRCYNISLNTCKTHVEQYHVGE